MLKHRLKQIGNMLISKFLDVMDLIVVHLHMVIIATFSYGPF